MNELAQRSATAPSSFLVAQVERLSDGLEELKPLLPIHYGELSEHREHGYKLAPNYDEYLQRELAGQVLYVTLRDAERTLVGYFVGFVTRCLHYRALTLSEDVFYVVPDARGWDGGNTLLDEVEREAKRRGVYPARMGFKTSHAKFMMQLLQARGYKPFEITWIKWLGDTSDA